MNVTPLIFSCILYALAYVMIRYRLLASPCCAFLGMLVLSYLHDSQGYAVIPMDSSLIFGWLCVTVLVTVVTFLQPRPVRESLLGLGYITGGAVVGMAVGLLGFTVTYNVNAMYGLMILTTAIGTFFGFLSFTRTPRGKDAAAGSGKFFPYLLAKGFPVAVTVMMTGVVLVILIALYNLNNPVR